MTTQGNKNTLTSRPQRAGSTLVELNLDDPRKWDNQEIRKQMLRALICGPEKMKAWRLEMAEFLHPTDIAMPLALVGDEVQKIPWADYADDSCALGLLAPLRGSNFSGSDMRSVCDLIIEYYETTGKRADKNLAFVNCDLTNTNWSNSEIYGVNFTDCNLSQANFKHSKWYNFVMTRATVNETSFKENYFSYTDDLSFLAGHKPDFSGAQFNACKVILSHDLSEAIFDDAKVHGVQFRGGKIINSSFEKTDFAETRFIKTQIEDCDFTKAVNLGREIIIDLLTAPNSGNKV